MNVERAAHNTITQIKAYATPNRPPPQAARHPEGRGPCHAMWMLGEILTANMPNDRANRWLGYAQAILIEHGLMVLEAAKRANKDA